MEQSQETVKFVRVDEAPDWVMDKKGYFLIRINRGRADLEVAWCAQEGEITQAYAGKDPTALVQRIINDGCISRMDHAAYLRKELEKARLALDNGLVYVQDDELDLQKKAA